MGLSKLAIISIATGSVIGIGSITAAAVIVSQNQNTTNQKTNSVAWTTLNPATTIQQKLESFLKTIQATDLVLTKKKSSETQAVKQTKKSLVEENTQALKVSDVYAFNASEYEFGLDENKPIPEGVSFQIKIDQFSTKNLANLNTGKITLKLEAKNEEINVTSSIDLVVDSFKKPNEAIKKLIDSTNDDYTLDILSDDKQGIKKFSSLEYLNKQDLKLTTITPRVEGATEENEAKYSGLSVLLNEIRKEEAKDATLSIQGEVKLEKIAKDEKGKVNFYLTSANDSFLKVTRKEKANSEFSQILVKQIKINNLAISSINVVPLQNNKQTSDQYTNELKDKWTNGETKADELTVTVPKTGDSTVKLPISAYKLEKDSKPESIEAYLEVNFGSGKYIKTYNTSQKQDLEELKNAGFNFGVFSKDITKKPTTPKPEVSDQTVIDPSNKLEAYFKKDSNKTPVSKPEEKGDGMKQDGEYFLNRIMNLDEANKIKLGVNMPVKPTGRDSSPQEQSQNQNWLVFANYSYPNMNINEETKMVLYAPSLSLIHLEIKNKVE